MLTIFRNRKFLLALCIASMLATCIPAVVSIFQLVNLRKGIEDIERASSISVQSRQVLDIVAKTLPSFTAVTLDLSPDELAKILAETDLQFTKLEEAVTELRSAGSAFISKQRETALAETIKSVAHSWEEIREQTGKTMVAAEKTYHFLRILDEIHSARQVLNSIEHDSTAAAKETTRASFERVEHASILIAAAILGAALIGLIAMFSNFQFARNIKRTNEQLLQQNQEIENRDHELKKANASLEERVEQRAAQAAVDARIQAEIDTAVQAALKGDFSRRVDPGPTEGVMRRLSEGMNQLLAIVDRGLADTVAVVSSMAQGDLTKHIASDYQGSFATLKDDTNRMGEQMRTIVGRIVDVTSAVQHATGEIGIGVIDLSERTEHQASSLEKTTASMERLSATVRQNADNAQEANHVATAARSSATIGGEVVDRAVAAMSRIEGSTKKIADIVGLIQEIAFQTNLLALNAAVEAARAGDAGKGFAVVANEVRALAHRTAEASKDIKQLIANSDDEVREGVELVNRAGESLGDIVASVKKVADFVSEIAAASREQSTGIDQVGQAINAMEEMTQQNGTLAEETTAALLSAQGQVEVLRKVVTFFKTDEEALQQTLVEFEDELDVDTRSAVFRYS